MLVANRAHSDVDGGTSLLVDLDQTAIPAPWHMVVQAVEKRLARPKVLVDPRDRV